MTDRELLELAAKAAGINYDSKHDSKYGLWVVIDYEPHEYTRRYWNPLADDGDALRLAVKLRLTVSWDRFNGEDYATATPAHTHQGYDCIVDQCHYAATRRAIVRAAAEIGKELK